MTMLTVTAIITRPRAFSSSTEHSHHHHAHDARGLTEILALINHATLPEPVKAMASRTFELLGASEAKIHDKPIESIHFHEVGAVDAIVDIVLAAAAAHSLGIDAWYCSALNVGSGTVQCAHGRFPVPAPATADLLRGAPTYSAGPAMELVTPTGAALVRALDCRFGPVPTWRVDKIGYGAGTRNPDGFANVLRLSLGSTDAAGSSAETVTVIETAIDDLSPQVMAYVMEQALATGALDVMCTPVLMKKNRPGHLLTLLAERKNAAQLEDLLFRETSTLGLRIREERRSVLDRKNVTVNIFGETVRIKVASRDGQELHAAPEFEDCRKIAERQAIPLKHVQEAALAGLPPDFPMTPTALLELLSAIKEGKVTPEDGMKRLAHWPGEDLGFAKIDHQRALRTGLPEVIYAAGKTDRPSRRDFCPHGQAWRKRPGHPRHHKRGGSRSDLRA